MHTILINIYCFGPHFNPLKLWGLSYHYWYPQKALNEAMCKVVISQILEQRS